MGEAANPAGIAVLHTVFNVTATVFWLPFSKVLVKLACLTIKDTPEDLEESQDDQDFMILESRFLEKPAFAVEQGRNAARRMAADSRKSLCMALGLLDNYDGDRAERVDKLESKVDRYEDELGTYLVKLNNRDLSERDSHSVSIMLHCIGDFERISDHAVNIMESARELYEKGMSFSEKAREELAVLTRAVDDIVKTAYTVFDRQDVKLAEKIEPLEEVIDELSKEVKRRHVQRLRQGACTIEMGFVLSDVVTNLERISDHCSNIGVCVTQVREDMYDTHSHIDDMKHEAGIFQNKIEAVRGEYVLP